MLQLDCGLHIAYAVHLYASALADRLLFVLVAHKGDSNPGRSI